MEAEAADEEEEEEEDGSRGGGDDEGNMWPPLEAEDEEARRYRKYGKLNWGDRVDYSLQVRWGD